MSRPHGPGPRPHAPPPLSGQRLVRPARRPKRFGTLEERDRRRSRRVASLALAALWLVALAALLAAPVFHIRHVDISGNRRLTTEAVVAAAGLQHPGSVFQVDPGVLERRLMDATWVRAAWVSAQLPDRVSIQVDEWQPVAVYRSGGGPPWYLSDQAVALGPASQDDAAALLGIDGPAQQAPRAGQAPLERALLVALVNIQRALPGLIGQEVQSFTIDSCGNLTLDARTGWKGQFGRVNTAEEMARLKDKVAALRALAASGAVDFNRPGLQYVNVMNPAVVAVPTPTPVARAGRASPSSSQSPSPLPSPAAPAAVQVAPCH